MKKWLKVVGIFLLFLLIAGGAFTALTYNRLGGHLRRAKEVVLQQNLWTMRRAIDFYWQDREKPPQSLQDLISSGYLREIPLDPVTQSNQTWIIEREKVKSVPNTSPGIVNVRSAAAGADRGGKPYNQY